MAENTKKFIVMGKNDYVPYDTYEIAEEKAKRYVAKGSAAANYGGCSEAHIFESIASVKAPVPEAVVTKFA